MSYILGISCYYHDASAALICDGEIIAAAQEERFTRKKHDDSFPIHAVQYCLAEAAIDISSIDAIVYYEKPLLKFERILEIFSEVAPRGFLQFYYAMHKWLKDKIFMRKHLKKVFSQLDNFDAKKSKIYFSEHHLSHAASAYYASPYSEAAVLTIDGVGEWTTCSMYHGKDQHLVPLAEMHFPHSVGMLYSAFTYFLGFKVNSGEYKLMGLAPYGDASSPQTKEFISLIYKHLLVLYEDGSIKLNMHYFTYTHTLKMVNNRQWEKLFGVTALSSDSPITNAHCNLALAIQTVTEDIVLRMATHIHRLTGSENLCIAGGVALNCVANGKLQRSGIFKHIYVQPASGDAGAALGAAWSYYHQGLDIAKPTTERMKGSLLGKEFSSTEIKTLLRKYKATFVPYDVNIAAQTLMQGKILGVFRGREEYGPRALGNRSIIASPLIPEMQNTLNLKIKFREGFRPFAPIVLEEKASQWFNLQQPSPYMLLVAPLLEHKRLSLPPNFNTMTMKEKLLTPRSAIQAVTHVDFSARIQTVDDTSNPQLYQLLTAFYQLTECPILVNTSFNVRGEPIVHSPEDAYRCFMQTDMDVLVLGDFMLYKNEQQNHMDKSFWNRTFEKD